MGKYMQTPSETGIFHVTRHGQRYTLTLPFAMHPSGTKMAFQQNTTIHPTKSQSTSPSHPFITIYAGRPPLCDEDIRKQM